ncbi:RlpA-like double-psi beta-barrel domain-containing protein [Streptomyces sp. BR1]|uniref:RlpA-like double-psi beta-barrel domain-containing protein n=1 Tax=Streptomyces sp. BR1 TaxID=1592323 RepID=UPI00402BE357
MGEHHASQWLLLDAHRPAATFRERTMRKQRILAAAFGTLLATASAAVITVSASASDNTDIAFPTSCSSDPTSKPPKPNPTTKQPKPNPTTKQPKPPSPNPTTKPPKPPSPNPTTKPPKPRDDSGDSADSAEMPSPQATVADASSSEATGCNPSSGFSHARATFYSTGMGACGITNNDGDFIVALNSAQFGSGFPSAQCGKKIKITYKGKSATATITDECPGCPYAGLDMSPALFSHFENQDKGTIYVDWKFVQ